MISTIQNRNNIYNRLLDIENYDLRTVVNENTGQIVWLTIYFNLKDYLKATITTNFRRTYNEVSH